MNKNILNTIINKKSNLILSIDFTSSTKILNLAEKLGKYLCGVKIHVDIIDDFSIDFAIKLRNIADQQNFLILCDRKFADIGNTVHHQLHYGTFKISTWADLITVHTIMGEGTIQGLISDKKTPGILLLAQASSKNNLINESYTKKTIEIAEKYSNYVAGFICQGKITDSPKFIHFTPGVNISDSADNLGQQYNTPQYVIDELGSDVIIVGRGIYHSDDPITMAELYRNIGWKSFSNKKFMCQNI